MADQKANNYIRRYFYFYEKNQMLDVSTYLKAYKMFVHPFAYTNNKYRYELLSDGNLGEGFEQTQEYDIVWELIYKILKDPAFVQNGSFIHYGVDNVVKESNYIEFIRGNEEWKIYLEYERLEKEYPVKLQYLVFFDEDTTVFPEELYPTVAFFVNKLGRDNIYTDVVRYDYEDPNRTQKFFVIYNGNKPSIEKQRAVIRQDLVLKYGYDKAKELYPYLFIDSNRRIFLMHDSTAYPIPYEDLKEFVSEHEIFRPEVLLLLDWSSPVVVEYGVSDMIPNLTPIEEVDYQSNRYIFFLSKVINYLQGKVITPEFIQEAQFYENETYAAFVYQGIEWQVMKMKYNNDVFGFGKE